MLKTIDPQTIEMKEATFPAYSDSAKMAERVTSIMCSYERIGASLLDGLDIHMPVPNVDFCPMQNRVKPSIMVNIIHPTMISHMILP